MGYLKRILSLILTFTILLACVGCGTNKYVEVSENISYAKLPGNLNTYLYDNPDRGYRTEMLLTIKDKRDGTETDWRTLCVSDGIEANRKKMLDLFSLYCPGNIYSPKLIIMYIILADYRDREISDGALEILDLFFERCRESKKKGIFRIGYHLEVQYDHRRNEECKQALLNICATEETMLAHIEQLKPFIAKNKDAIHKLSSGFIGMAGEMVYAYQYPTVNYDNIIKAVVEKLAVPNGLYYSVRQPKYKLELLKNDPGYKYADIIGFNNDAIYGETTKSGWNSGGWQKDFPSNNWWEYTIENAYRTPQSGEMLVNPSYITGSRYTEKVPSGLEVILELAHLRYNTFSHWHTLGENYGKDNVMQRWIDNEIITPELLDSVGVPYDPSWFTDINGKYIQRNPYEFIRDHLGYKLEAQNATVSGQLGKEGKLTVDLNLKNYGFSAAFCLNSGFAILDSEYNVVSAVEAGDPEKWYGLRPSYFTTERNSSVLDDLMTHKVSAELTLPKKSGKYHIAFYLKNDMNDFACLSNDMPYEGDGYNILYSLEI